MAAVSNKPTTWYAYWSHLFEIELLNFDLKSFLAPIGLEYICTVRMSGVKASRLEVTYTGEGGHSLLKAGCVFNHLTPTVAIRVQL